MRRFVPIRAEGALVLGLLGVIAGTTFAINEFADPHVTTRTTVGSPVVQVKQVDEKGGVKPGPVQPRVMQQPVFHVPTETGVGPVVAEAPVATPPKKTVVATTPIPAVATPEPAVEEPGGLMPDGTGAEPGTGTGTGSEPTDPGTGTGTGTGANPGGGTKPDGCLLAPLCAPSQPTVAPTSAATALPGS